MIKIINNRIILLVGIYDRPIVDLGTRTQPDGGMPTSRPDNNEANNNLMATHGMPPHHNSESFLILIFR